MEPRLSIYGAGGAKEWEDLAGWFYGNGVAHRRSKLMIQVPRLFALFRGIGKFNTFAQYLDNIFRYLCFVFAFNYSLFVSLFSLSSLFLSIFLSFYLSIFLSLSLSLSLGLPSTDPVVP